MFTRSIRPTTRTARVSQMTRRYYRPDQRPSESPITAAVGLATVAAVYYVVRSGPELRNIPTSQGEGETGTEKSNDSGLSER